VLTVACWIIGHRRIQTDEDGTTPRKTRIIDLELNRLNIDIATPSETWLNGSGFIREEHYTFLWSGHPEGERIKHGVGVVVRNCLITRIEHPRNHPSLHLPKMFDRTVGARLYAMGAILL